MTGALTGVGALTRQAVRRDRVRLLGWLVGCVGMAAYCGAALRTVYADPDDLRAVVGFVSGPAGTVLSGPGFGLDDPAGPTYGAALAGIYGVWVALVAAFAGMTLVVRLTRAEEETGRLELVRSAGVGRAAPLGAAAVVAVGLQLAVGLLTWAVLVAGGYDAAGSALLAAGVSTVGLVFAALAAVTAQLVEHARSALALAALGLAAAMVVRGAGDVLEPGGSALSWFSPLAWAQQTRAFVDDRWWPLLPGLLTAALLAALAARLAHRRDLGAGLLRSRPGPDRAGGLLGTPLGLLLRLERGAALGWSAALLVAGLLYGALTDAVRTSLGDLDSTLVLSALGGDPSRLVDGYLGTCALVTALAGAAYAVSAASRLGAEERTGRLEPLLASAVPRRTWLGCVLLVAAAGSSAAVALGGLGMGLGAAAVTGSWGYLPSVVGAHLAYLPGLWVVVAVTGLLQGIARGLGPLAWVVVAYAAAVGLLAGPLDLPGWAVDASPLGAVPLLPLEDPRALPLVVLTAVAGVAAVVAAVAFARRDAAT